MTTHRILVVDDEETIVEVFRAVLEDLGHEVQTVGTGEAALEALDGFHPELVFLDIKLPGMSGIDVLKQVRARGADGPRVVMVTGVLDDDLYDSSIYSRFAADGFITKPCSFQSIEDCIGKVMGDAGAYLRTPRDELRYATAKLRQVLETSGTSLAVAELAPGLPMLSRLGATFGGAEALRGTLAVRGPAGLRALLRDDPEFTETAGLYTATQARLLAERVRNLFGTDWGLAFLLVPDEDDAGRQAWVSVVGSAPERGGDRQFRTSGDEATREACHAALVHAHGVVAPG